MVQKGLDTSGTGAPTSVCFFSRENGFIGDKDTTLASTISTVTRIPTTALKGLELSRFSKKERLYWTKGRTTTVPEDAAYCLMGIFDVELHMLYADGDYNKKKNTVEVKLHRANEERNIDAEGSQDVLRIGGASWNDLTKSLGRMEDINNLSRIVTERVKALLTNRNVRYE